VNNNARPTLEQTTFPIFSPAETNVPRAQGRDAIAFVALQSCGPIPDSAAAASANHPSSLQRITPASRPGPDPDPSRIHSNKLLGHARNPQFRNSEKAPPLRSRVAFGHVHARAGVVRPETEWPGGCRHGDSLTHDPAGALSRVNSSASDGPAADPGITPSRLGSCLVAGSRWPRRPWRVSNKSRTRLKKEINDSWPASERIATRCRPAQRASLLSRPPLDRKSRTKERGG
jgi:hypothetical protein